MRGMGQGFLVSPWMVPPWDGLEGLPELLLLPEFLGRTWVGQRMDHKCQCSGLSLKSQDEDLGLFPESFGWCFPEPWIVFLYTCTDQCVDTLGGPSADVQGSFFVLLSSLWYTLLSLDSCLYVLY